MREPVTCGALQSQPQGDAEDQHSTTAKKRGPSMYLHLGQDTVVRVDDIVAIFDLENASIAKSTKGYLANAQRMGQVVNVSTELPKSFVVCQHRGQTKVYVSQISSATLKKRTGYIDGIANVGER